MVSAIGTSAAGGRPRKTCTKGPRCHKTSDFSLFSVPASAWASLRTAIHAIRPATDGRGRAGSAADRAHARTPRNARAVRDSVPARDRETRRGPRLRASPVLKSTIQRTPSATKVRSIDTCATPTPSDPASAHSLIASACAGSNSQRPRGSASKRPTASMTRATDGGELRFVDSFGRELGASRGASDATRAASHAAMPSRAICANRRCAIVPTCFAASRAQSNGTVSRCEGIAGRHGTPGIGAGIDHVAGRRRRRRGDEGEVGCGISAAGGRAASAERRPEFRQRRACRRSRPREAARRPRLAASSTAVRCRRRLARVQPT